MHSLNLQCHVSCSVASVCKSFAAHRPRSVALSISRFLLFVDVAHGVPPRATFTKGDQSACTHPPDHSCLPCRHGLCEGFAGIQVGRNNARFSLMPASDGTYVNVDGRTVARFSVPIAAVLLIILCPGGPAPAPPPDGQKGRYPPLWGTIRLDDPASACSAGRRFSLRPGASPRCRRRLRPPKFDNIQFLH